MTDKAVFLMREYVKYSLYDRISTRPFLTMIEKKFIAFQILFAMRQCHTLGVSFFLIIIDVSFSFNLSLPLGMPW